MAIGCHSERAVVFSLYAYAGDLGELEASGVFSDRVAAGSRRTYATDFQNSFIELLASYFSPTFPLLMRVAIGTATILGLSSSPKL